MINEFAIGKKLIKILTGQSIFFFIERIDDLLQVFTIYFNFAFFSLFQEVLHTICYPHGQVHRIVIFKKNGVQAMVEYPFYNRLNYKLLF